MQQLLHFTGTTPVKNRSIASETGQILTIDRSRYVEPGRTTYRREGVRRNDRWMVATNQGRQQATQCRQKNVCSGGQLYI